MLKKLFQFRLV